MDGITGEEASGGTIVVAIAKKHQSTVTVRLVLLPSHIPERQRTRPRPVHHQTETIVEHGVRRRLCPVTDRAGTPHRIPMQEFARPSSALAQSGRVDRSTVLENRTARSRAIGGIVTRLPRLS